MNAHRFDTFHLILVALSGALLLFIVAPLLGLVLASSIDEVRGAALDDQVRRSIGLTLFAAMAATLAGAIPAIPLAYLLARNRLPFSRTLAAIVDLPIVIPHAAAGLALLTVLSGDAWIARLARPFGIEFVSTALGVTVAMAFVSIPYLVHTAREGFAAVPENLELTALNHGATPGRVFYTISLPLASRSILTGTVLMWARGMSEFGSILFIAYRPTVAPILLWERFASYGLAYARPVAILLIAIALAVFVALRYLQRDNADAQR